MKFHLKKWIKSIFVVSLLMGASLVHADLMIKEQVLDITGLGGNDAQAGGNSVAIDGEWAFVGNTVKCQAFVYKWDYLTYEWGDGEGNAGVAYTTLENSGTACTGAGTGGFGQSISTDNGLVVVGAPLAKDGGNERYGKIHFFTFDETVSTLAADANDTNRRGWVRQTTIGWPEDRNASDVLDILDDRQGEAEYGTSVSVRYDPLGSGKAILVIGAPGYDDPIIGDDCGKIYVYEWNNADKSVLLINGQSGEYAGDRVGTAVTSNGNELLVSAPNFDDGGDLALDSGAAYLFDYNTTSLLFTLEHRIRSEGYDTPSNPVPPFGYVFEALPGTEFTPGGQVGLNLSYQGSTIALSGNHTYLYDHNHSAGTFTFENKVFNTNGGDVSQSGSLINIAERSVSFNVYFDKTNLGTPPEANVTHHKSELDWGRDISLSFPKLMVNGNYRDGNGNNDQGVAYAYTPTCGVGGKLSANQWQMIGLQCDITTGPASTDTKAGIAEIFSESLGDYNTTWAMFRQPDGNYVGHQSDYVQMDANDTMKIGVGYWIISINDVKFQVNNVGLSTNPIYGHHPTKQLDPLTRPLVAAVTKLDVKAMMGGGAAIGRGDVDPGGTPNSDFRVMFSNPLNVPTSWDQAIMGEPTDVQPFDVVSGYSGWFSGASVAWIYEPTTNWYIVAASVPGLTHAIMPGQGFRILFSNAFYEDVLSNGDVPTLELDLTDLK